MKQNILLSIYTLVFSSCATIKWKTNYINKNIGIIQDKYGVKDMFEVTTTGGVFVSKPYEKLTRKDVKKNVIGWEALAALIPDSVHMNTSLIDSFYLNKNKIAYIKNHSINRSTIHVIE